MLLVVVVVFLFFAFFICFLCCCCVAIRFYTSFFNACISISYVIVDNRANTFLLFSLSLLLFLFLSSSFSIRSRARSINFSRLCFEMYTHTHSHKIDADGFHLFSWFELIDLSLSLLLTHSPATPIELRNTKIIIQQQQKNKLTWKKILLRFIYWVCLCVFYWNACVMWLMVHITIYTVDWLTVSPKDSKRLWNHRRIDEIVEK